MKPGFELWLKLLSEILPLICVLRPKDTLCPSDIPQPFVLPLYCRWKNMEEHFMVVFRATDTDSSGTLDLQEFRKAVKEDPDHPFSLLWSTLPKPKEKPAATGNLPVAGK